MGSISSGLVRPTFPALPSMSLRCHGADFENLVIVLIAAEILVAAVNIVVDLYAGVD